ncbi:Os11g0423501 [Oryza sativa Japonica Group]|uniref:Os11g0423501 protein n=1 Tax=Oryza sativa subsp. japonica TaxID=39947 RepID=A0A0P0Y1U7_ORYSJ|nr:Os11g0423501 [Oryza sativa Japonica Group]
MESKLLSKIQIRLWSMIGTYRSGASEVVALEDQMAQPSSTRGTAAVTNKVDAQPLGSAATQATGRRCCVHLALTPAATFHTFLSTPPRLIFPATTIPLLNCSLCRSSVSNLA